MWLCSDAGSSGSFASSRHRLVVTVVVVGPFEEEDEGTGIASDVVNPLHLIKFTPESDMIFPYS